jgi:hypothetical protein
VAYPTLTSYCSDGTLTFDRVIDVIEKSWSKGFQAQNRTKKLMGNDTFGGFKSYRQATSNNLPINR